MGDDLWACERVDSTYDSKKCGMQGAESMVGGVRSILGAHCLDRGSSKAGTVMEFIVVHGVECCVPRPRRMGTVSEP